MPHDPQKIADTRDWLRKAAEDLEAAETLFRQHASFAATVVFHCQQGAEKAFKAFLFWHGTSFRKTHDIEELGNACQVHDATLSDVANRAVNLTPYAWRFRYPGDVFAPALPDVDSALALAREVYEAVLARLPEEVRP